ncbi:MAG: ribosome maturation factor RimM [Cytophagales bacterium]|nr:ribosome maturation factor RimM [Cytophagales bacterium]
MAHTGYIYWGRISRPHGFKGEVSLIIENEVDFKKKLPEAVFVEQGTQLVPYFILQIKNSSKGVILGLEECTTEIQAKALYGSDVYVREAETKKPKRASGYGHVVGFEVIDSILGSIGPVDSIMEMPMQQLLVLHIDGNEALIPAVPSFVQKVDEASKKIYLELPEGLLDVYLKPGSDPSEMDDQDEDGEEE